jgi:hypothetical protein
MSALYPDISGVTPVKTHPTLGGVDVGRPFVSSRVNKKTGSGTKIVQGKILKKDASTTPDTYILSTAGAAKPLVVSGFPSRIDPADPTKSAGEEEVTVQGISQATVILEADGVIKANERVMAGASGKVKEYDGSGEEKVCGRFIYKPGGAGANIINTDAANADLVVCNFNGE